MKVTGRKQELLELDSGKLTNSDSRGKNRKSIRA